MDAKKTQTGRSMIEMMGYLMVSMGVIVAMGRLVSSAFDNHKYSTASYQLTELVGAIVRSSAIDVDYTEVVEKVQKGDRDLIPRSYRVVVGNNSAKIYHAFGGTVDVSLFAQNPEKFSLKYNNLSKKQCVELALKNWSKNQYADLFAVVVNNKYYWYWKAYGNKDGGSFSVADGTCEGVTCALPTSRYMLTGVNDNGTDGQCTDSRSNTVMWIFN